MGVQKTRPAIHHAIAGTGKAFLIHFRRGNPMRALAYLALPLVLAVCSSGQAQASPPSEKPAAKSMMTANGSKPGTYDVKHADGSVTRTILNADGSYRDIGANGKLAAEGKWSVMGGKTCFAPTTKGAAHMCFKETPPAKDGSFTATPDKGKPVKVTPAGASAA
jgi:hypothetical protein